ncbi:MAG: adenosylcobalamin-dependent ribonucleoside-diphosphate reductase [bacterium]
MRDNQTKTTTKIQTQAKFVKGPLKIRKRNGDVVDFDNNKITEAIFKAAKAVGGSDRKLAEKIAAKVVKSVQDIEQPTVEEIQDKVEKILIEEGHAKTAKAYILYRAKRTEEREAELGEDVKEVLELKKLGVKMSRQAVHVLNKSANFDEIGRLIFLDRYSIKTKRDDIAEGDLVIVITKDEIKYPKKDLGIVKEIDARNQEVKLHMVTGVYADKESNFEFTQDLLKCEKPREAIDDSYQRIAKAIASIEPEEQQEHWEKEFLDQLRQKHLQPGGRIMTGANVGEDGKYTENLTLYNCFVIPNPADSRGSIIKEALFQLIEIMARGGGVGLSLSSLRPRLAYVRGVHGRSSGSVSWGGIFSFATGLVEQGGARRGALMLMQADWHPDVVDFIEAKMDKGTLENANISVMVSDHFMEALKNDADWPLEYPDYEDPAYNDIYDTEWEGDIWAWKAKGYPTKVYKIVKARELWDKIITSAHASAEPGVVFMERYNKLSNSSYYNTLTATNPCGEQGLPGWGVCNLGHLNLPTFLKVSGKDKEGPLYDVDWDKLAHSARVLTRFLDNVIDLSAYHFAENEENQKRERRVGGGTIGLGEMLIKLRLKYGSAESIKMIDKIYECITTNMYLTSSELAAEKGTFPKYERDKFLETGFIKTLPEKVKKVIKENGIRNVTLTTQAPTGSVGTMLGTSTGIEPFYEFEFYRQSRLGFHKVSIPLAKQYQKEDGTLPDYFVSAMDLDPLDHIKVQAAVQKWTDSSISKTANAPADFTVDQTKEVYEMAYDLGCKGVTVYRDHSRSEQVLSTDANMEKKNDESANGKGACKIEFKDGQLTKSCSDH